MPPEDPPHAICVLFVTIDAEHAEPFARSAVQQRLVACANLVPGAKSLYWWDGELCEDLEVLVWMEAPVDDVEARIAALAALHPYDTPKIIALPPAAVHEPYARWCVAATAPAD